MQKIVLFGGGLNANVCIDILEKDANYDIVGIIDSIADIGTVKYGYPVIGRQEDIVTLIEKNKINAGCLTIGDNYDRKLVRDFIISLAPEFNFINTIHPTVSLGRNVKLGKGIVMMANVVVNPNSQVEDFCMLNTGAQLDHDSFMGEFSQLSVGSVTGGKVSIGKFSAITVGVTIVDRINIGENTVIGSGSLVLQDLPSNVLAYGNPAKVIRFRKPGEKYLKS